MKTPVHDPELEEGIMRRGFPRPVFDTETIGLGNGDRRFLPTPYTAETSAVSVISEARASECLRDVVCSVCGEEVDFTDEGYITVLPKRNRLTYESGPFHLKCATLTMKFCPHIAKSDEWSMAMVHMDVWIRHTDYWLDGPGRQSSFAPGLDLNCVTER